MKLNKWIGTANDRRCEISAPCSPDIPTIITQQTASNEGDRSIKPENYITKRATFKWSYGAQETWKECKKKKYPSRFQSIKPASRLNVNLASNIFFGKLFGHNHQLLSCVHPLMQFPFLLGCFFFLWSFLSYFDAASWVSSYSNCVYVPSMQQRFSFVLLLLLNVLVLPVEFFGASFFGKRTRCEADEQKAHPSHLPNENMENVYTPSAQCTLQVP